MKSLIFGLVPGALTKTQRISDVLKQCQDEQFATQTVALPLSEQAPSSLLNIIEKSSPAIILGVAPVQWSHELETEPELSQAIRVENFALNISNDGANDDANQSHEASPLIADGPPGYQSQCNPSLIVTALEAAGHQAVTSYFPGTSASNACHYQVLHLLKSNSRPTRCVLMHLPCDMIGPDHWRKLADNNAWSHTLLLDAVQHTLAELTSQTTH